MDNEKRRFRRLQKKLREEAYERWSKEYDLLSKEVKLTYRQQREND